MTAVKFIYVALRELGIEEEDDRRDLFERVTGKRSLRAMTPGEQDAVADDLRRKGVPPAPAISTLRGPYAKKLQALWIAAWNLGLVSDKRDTALMAFVKRQCGIAHMRWLRDAADAEKVIEALKKWIAREAGVSWTSTDGPAFLRNQAAKVAWAIWCKLHPTAQVSDLSAFHAEIVTQLKRPVALDKVTMREWQTIAKALGVQLRRASQKQV